MIAPTRHQKHFLLRRQNLRQSSLSSMGQFLRSRQGEDCTLCGGYCPWDVESEWEEKWSAWEKKLAYYDRSTGPLLDEWYEDEVNKGKAIGGEVQPLFLRGR